MNNIFKSKDLMLSAALVAEGVPLLDAQREASYLVFVFGERELCKDIEKKWFGGKLIGNLCDYAHALRRLKSLIHSRI